MGGGGGYSRDESPSSSSRSSSWDSSYRTTPTGRSSTTKPAERRINDLVSPLKTAIPGSQKFKEGTTQPIPGSMKFQKGHRTFECRDQDDIERTPVVVAFDVTKRRGNDLPIIYDKLPMIIGQIIGKNYLPNPSISFCAYGDASSGDKMPVQACYFENDARLDEGLRAIYLERGGGGKLQESSELIAYLYATRSQLDSVEKRGEKGFFFILGDGTFFDKVSAAQVKKYLGDDIPEDLDSIEIFRQLQEMYEVFFIFPKKSWQDRRAGIDAEMATRVISAGGQIDDVDIRCTLSWNTCDDLDIHCIGPDGHIYYGQDRQGDGWLDVDANAGGARTRKPVENIRYPRGRAKKGTYQFFVQHYAAHDGNEHPHFRAELEVNDGSDIQHIEGTAPAPCGSGNTIGLTPIFTVDYDPRRRVAADDREKLIESAYDDAAISAKWAEAIPEENILTIDDPKAIADVIIGVLALRAGSDLEAYDADLASRGQTDARRAEVGESLRNIAGSSQTVTVEGDLSAMDDLFTMGDLSTTF